MTPAEPALVAATAAAPTVLGGRYRLQGPYGVSVRTFLAHDLRLERRVLVKRFEGGPVDEQAFRREAAALQRLRHPHVVRLLDVGLEPNPFLVLQWVAGASLRDHLARHRRLPAFEAVRLARQLASALVEVHRQGLLHGDVKPENVVLSETSPRPLVLVDYDASVDLTQDGAATPSFTPSYLPPERRSDPSVPPSPASDVYAAAAVVFECLVGRRLAEGESPRLAERVPTHPDLARVVDRGLAVDPAERFRSAAELGMALGEIPDEALTDLDLGGFESLDGQEQIRTVDSLDAGPTELPPAHDEKVALRSSEQPRIWFLLDDPVMREPAVMELMDRLDQRYSVRLLDEDDRFSARWEGMEAPPWAVVFGAHHVDSQDPLLGWLRDSTDVAAVLLTPSDRVEISSRAVDWCGLDGLLLSVRPVEDLLDAVETIVGRHHQMLEHYDCLRLALRDAREDRARADAARPERDS